MLPRTPQPLFRAQSSRKKSFESPNYMTFMRKESAMSVGDFDLGNNPENSKLARINRSTLQQEIQDEMKSPTEFDNHRVGKLM